MRLAFAAPFLLLLALASAWECPTVDEDTQLSVARTCVADPDGLCGESCFAAIRDAALARKDDVAVPCDGGLEGVLDLLRGCMKSEAGLEFDDCGGETTARVRAYADQIRCEGGGTLADTLD